MIFLAAPQGFGPLPASTARAVRNDLPAYFRFVAPLAAPAEGDVIDLVGIVDPATPWPPRLKHARRPTVVLIGDDPGSPDGMGGPDAWRCTLKLSRWVRGVIVHAAGGEPQHYAEATRGALRVGRVALIETTSKHARAWAERMNCQGTLLVLPKDGAHPIQKAEAEQ